MIQEQTTWPIWFRTFGILLGCEGISVDQWVLRRLEENVVLLGIEPRGGEPRDLEHARKQVNAIHNAAKGRWRSADEDGQLAVKRVHSAVRCLREVMENQQALSVLGR